MKNHIKITKLFNELVITYIFTISIPIILAIIITGTAKNISLKRQIDMYTSSLEQGMNLFENQLEDYNRVAQKYMFDKELQLIASQTNLKYGNKIIYNITQFQKNLHKNFSDIMVRDNYCMILKNGIAFNNTTMSSDLEFFYKYSRKYENLSFESYVNKSFEAKKPVLIPMQNIYNNKVATKAVTYSYPIKANYKGNEDSADAVVQFLIKEDYINSLFSSVISDEDSSVYILDEDSNVIANMGVSREENFTVTGEKGYIFLNKGYMAIYVKSSKNGYTYVATLPTKNAMSDALNLQKTLFSWILLFSIISIAVGIYFSWKYSLPVKNLVNNIKILLAPEMPVKAKKDQKQSEYEYLQESFQRLIKMNNTNRSNSFFNYLFIGEFRQNKDVIQEGSKIGLQLGDRKYCVTCMDFHEKQVDLTEIFNTKQNHHLVGYQQNGRIIAALFSYEPDLEDNAIYENIVDYCEKISAQLDFVMKAGIGMAYSNEIDISYSYNQAGIAMASAQYGKMKNQMVVRYDAFTMNRSMIYFPVEVSEQISNFTRQGESEKLRKILKTVEDENFNNRTLSLTMEKLLISGIVSTMIRLISDDIYINYANAVDEILRYNDCHFAMGKIHEQFDILCNHYKHLKEDRKDANQTMLYEYMEENYSNSQLTLAHAAEELAFSEGYFSQFFKENTGEVFSKYLEKIRIHKAKELIQKDEDTLELISQKVGYSNSGTFRRAFKRVTGVSPSLWKEK